MGIVRHEEVKPINKGVWESVKLYVLVVGGAASVGLAAKYSLNWSGELPFNILCNYK